MKLPGRRPGIAAGVRGVAAKHRLRVGRCHRAKTREQHADVRTVHCYFARCNTNGVSIVPCRTAPLSFPSRNRPSKVIPISYESTETGSHSYVTRSKGRLLVLRPTITNSAAAPSAPRFVNLIDTCRA